MTKKNIPKPASNMVTFYHDIEQNIDSNADPEACRRTVKAFLALEKKYNVPATYNVAGKIFKEQPDLIEWIRQGGQEIAFHSYNHQPDWKPEYYAAEIKSCRQLSSAPKGYRSPLSQWDNLALKTLWKNNFLWNAEDDFHKEPYFIYKNLVRLPIAGDDWPIYTASLTIDEWVKNFRALLKKKRYFGFGSHDSVTSILKEDGLKAWEEVLKIAVEKKVLLVTFSEAADLFRRSSYARSHNITAKDWDKSIENNIRAIPLSAFKFHISNQIAATLEIYIKKIGYLLPKRIREFAKRILFK